MEQKFDFWKWHDRNYLKLLIIPLLIFILSISYVAYFYSQNNDFIRKDISLTGGTTITLYDNSVDISKLREDLSEKLEDLNLREISNIFTKKREAILIQTKSNPDKAKKILEDYLGYSLNEKNSSFEFTGPSLSQNFYLQLLLSIIYAFSFMGVVVFFLFSKKSKQKNLTLLLILLSPTLFIFLKIISINLAIIIALISLIISLFIFFTYNIPSFAVIVSAFADIFMTIAIIDLLGIRVSSAGIVALLMLIGYSVDTDILLTTRMLKREEGDLNERIFSAFKTGITMTLTSILAIFTAYLITHNISDILGQIFFIILVGLFFDLMNTWITNVSILKWHLLSREGVRK